MSMSFHMVGVVELNDDLYIKLIDRYSYDDTLELDLLKNMSNGYQPYPRIDDLGYDDIKKTVKFESSASLHCAKPWIDWLKNNSKGFIILYTYESTFSIQDSVELLVHNFESTTKYRDEFMYELNKYKVSCSGRHIYVPEESGYGYHIDSSVNWSPL